MEPDRPLILHANAVAVAGRGLLIRGASGSGKSSLSLAMMALGAGLVSDDRTEVRRDGATLMLSAPEAIAGLIEARGLGLLQATCIGPVALLAVLDLDVAETDRLPPHRTTEILGLERPLLHFSAWPTFPAALMQYLKQGREDE